MSQFAGRIFNEVDAPESPMLHNKFPGNRLHMKFGFDWPSGFGKDL